MGGGVVGEGRSKNIEVFVICIGKIDHITLD